MKCSYFSKHSRRNQAQSCCNSGLHLLQSQWPSLKLKLSCFLIVSIKIASSFESQPANYFPVELCTTYIITVNSNSLHGLKTVSVLFKFRGKSRVYPVHCITHFTFRCMSDWVTMHLDLRPHFSLLFSGYLLRWGKKLYVMLAVCNTNLKVCISYVVRCCPLRNPFHSFFNSCSKHPWIFTQCTCVSQHERKIECLQSLDLIL